MTFQLVDSGWDRVLETAVRAASATARIVCPFIKLRTAQRLVSSGRPVDMRVITRYDLAAFYAGVSDLAALRLLLESGARIRGIRHLHAKLYLFDGRRAIVTSANLTEAALLRNHEFGLVAEDAEIAAVCARYFDELWERAGEDLGADQLGEWEQRVQRRLLAGGPPVPQPGLGDEGVDLGLTAEPGVWSGWMTEAKQGFVKFFGQGSNRAERSMAVREEVTRSGCHRTCTYPRRPRQVDDGAVMFMGRLVKRPNDVLIYGRGIGMRHQPDRDVLSEAELRRRPHKENWPFYVRVHHTEFVAGPLSNGISLYELMDTLGPDAFAITQRHTLAGSGNTNPRNSVKQQPSVELSPQGLAWLSEKLEHAFEVHGRLPAEDLAMLE